jgi:hypothetical protein
MENAAGEASRSRNLLAFDGGPTPNAYRRNLLNDIRPGKVYGYGREFAK